MDIAILEKVIDSNDLTIGGGTASALAGSMAAGMTAMVARLSLKKPVDCTEEEYQAVIAEADKLAYELLDGANADGDAYTLVKEAYRLPKDTDEQKAARSAAIQQAGLTAISVPRDNAYRCCRVLELARQLVARSNPNCVSDLMSSLYLAQAGIKGCSRNIEVNLSLLKDPELIARFEHDIEVLKAYF